jgi:hypothetical protein
MSDFEVIYMDTDELDELGYPSKISVRKVGNDSVRDYRPANVALLQETQGGQIRCSCCGRQLKRKYISGWKRGWRYCIGCGARIMGWEG